ncbi:MAG TPA: hypothetical protein VKN99_17780 [Polyangia bacterium]|nr:hypothetical protein [Polyangia bacterium]
MALSMGCHYKVVAFGEIDRRAAEEVVARVVRIRGLAPREPVRFQAVSARALRRELEADLSRLKASGQLETWRKAWSRLGLLAADVDLERAYADLYSDEPAGYYDSETRRMRIVVKDRVRTEVMEVVGLLRRRDPIYGEALAHETVHALQDQKWHLTALEHAQQDDERLARRALVEGDASKVGFAYGALFFSSFESFSEFVAARIDTVNAGDTTPPWLRDNFQFPYVWGSLFVEKLYARGGWAAVDAAYERPPRSSEQILHPEKYLGPAPDPPRPVPIELPRPDGWKRIYSTTLGELGTRALVGRAAALGWGGDHAEVWEDGAGRLALAWATVWDDEAAAARFEAAYREHAGRVSEPFAMVRRGQRLAIVRGVEAAATVEAALTPPAP